MRISVTDGLTVTTSEVKVEVSPSEARGPRLAPGSSLSMTVARQRTAVITRANLAYVVSSDVYSLALCPSDWAPSKLPHGWVLQTAGVCSVKGSSLSTPAVFSSESYRTPWPQPASQQ